MVTCLSSLPWEIPWTEEPARLQSMGWLQFMGSQWVRHNWAHHSPKIVSLWTKGLYFCFALGPENYITNLGLQTAASLPSFSPEDNNWAYEDEVWMSPHDTDGRLSWLHRGHWNALESYYWSQDSDHYSLGLLAWSGSSNTSAWLNLALVMLAADCTVISQSIIQSTGLAVHPVLSGQDGKMVPWEAYWLLSHRP